MPVTIKSAEEIELMRESCRLLAEVHNELGNAIRHGISTMDINILGDSLDPEDGVYSQF